jgi:excinuclease ABC subunit C
LVLTSSFSLFGFPFFNAFSPEYNLSQLPSLFGKGFLVSGLFPNSMFNGFGPDRLRPNGDNPAFDVVAARKRSELRMRVRQLCPPLPGVYGMLDRRGVLIYVGKAKVLRHRLLGYFRAGSRHEKAGRIIERARAVVWEPAPNEFAALIRELELIRRWRPAYNVLGIPGLVRDIYLCLGRRPAPFVFATRQPTGKELAVFGPLRGAAMTIEAARRINDQFRLRDCSQQQAMHFAEEPDLFPILHTAGCLRYELGTCLGPCAAFTTKAAYSRQVRAAKAFLEGKDMSALCQIEAEMHAAAAREQFERAARLRDKLAPLRWVRERLDWLDRARQNYSFVYPASNVDGPPLWYLIRQARVCRVVAAPHDGPTRREAALAVRSVYDPHNLAALAPADHVDHVLLVAAWFRKFPEEREKVLTPEQAVPLCQSAAA